MKHPIKIVTSLQFFAWGLGYSINGLTGALIGIATGTVLGCVWHTVVFFHERKRINRKYSKYAPSQQ